ncbi:MAG: hypothetical protein JJU28_01055 [Cyclobacteriaceae bacterium]|nr:hypothetical protein [Cyclobacteriaceae bacterium]
MEFYENYLSLSAQERPTVIIYTNGNVNFEGVFNPNDVCPREEPLAHN